MKFCYVPFYCQNRDKVYPRSDLSEMKIMWTLPLTWACLVPSSKEWPAVPRCRRCGSNPWVLEIPWRKVHGTPLQYSCLEDPMSGEAWQAAVHRVAWNRTRLKWLSSRNSCHNHPSDRWEAGEQVGHCLRALRSSRSICVWVTVTLGSECQGVCEAGIGVPRPQQDQVNTPSCVSGFRPQLRAWVCGWRWEVLS